MDYKECIRVQLVRLIRLENIMHSENLIFLLLILWYMNLVYACFFGKCVHGWVDLVV